MKKFFSALLPAAALSLIFCASALSQTTIVIDNGDAPGAGFNDTTPATPVGGNNGTTVGEQRLIAFQAAANIWGAALISGPVIHIHASWAALPCTPTSGTLGAAGATSLRGNFANAPFTETWYGIAQANALAGSDLNGASAEIEAQFNLSLGTSGCLETVHWYYGLDNNHGPDIDLVTVLLHEFAHGLGFQSFTDESTGAQPQGFPSVYDRFLLDNSTGKTWPQMTDAERQASALNKGNLVWNGPFTTSDSFSVLTGGKDSLGHPMIYAPNPVAVGSSVSHWEIGATPNQLMEPYISATLTHNVNIPADLTYSLLKDIGWCAGCPAPSPTPTPTPTSTPTPTATPTATPTPIPVATPYAGTGAVAYQIDPTHSGSRSDSLTPPLTYQWSRDLGGPISYPLIADGKVFVTVSNQSTYGTRLYALDQRTGATVWGPIDITGKYNWSGLAYDNGRVFVVNCDGLLRAYDAASGAQLWAKQMPVQYSFSSSPTAMGGMLYLSGAGSGGTMYAVSQQDGAVRWTAGVDGGSGSPAVSPSGVYTSYGCKYAYDFSPQTGASNWYRSSSCPGSIGKTAVLFGGRLYVRDVSSGNLILDAHDGTELGSFGAGPAPAFAGSTGYFLNGSTLQARDAVSLNLLWSFTGDGTLSSAPIVDNGYVYIGSTSGKLYVLAATTGANVWTATLGSAVQAPNEGNVFAPLNGLAAGDGLIVVPASNLLVAYGSSVPTQSMIQLNSASYSVNEDAGKATITVTRTGDKSAPATVDYSTEDTDNFTLNCAEKKGQAFGRCDFSAVVGTLTFAAGETSKTFIVPIINDSYAEGTETFGVALSNLTGAARGAQFSATVTINDNEFGDTANPIVQPNDQGAAFFVRQHYLDFLAREPEPGEPWSGLLNNCSNQFNIDPESQATGCDRITVSGSFFGSPEYKTKGFYVIDFYRVAFNRLPTYSEFARDLASLAGATAAETSDRRAAFASKFVQQTDFTNIYGETDNMSFVTAMMSGSRGQAYNLTSITTPDPTAPDSTTKVTLTSTDLINRLNDSRMTRAQVLQAIVQSDEISLQREAMNAFVASQYYGYLRRTPDRDGFNSWITYLKNNPNDFRTMVNGFVNSAEYRLRFGPT